MQNFFGLLKRIWILLRYCLRRNRIVITQAVLSGKGSFVDIRYWLSRPDKINPQAKIYLLDQETGAHLLVMKLARIGPLQTNHALLAQTGSALFRNRNDLISSGSKVCLVLGDLKSDYIEVN